MLACVELELWNLSYIGSCDIAGPLPLNGNGR